MTAQELIKNMKNLMKAYDALEKEFNRRSEILRNMTGGKNEKSDTDRG